MFDPVARLKEKAATKACGFTVPFAGRRRRIFESEGSQTPKDDARDVSAHLIEGSIF